jgi:3-deoxy-D-manno-octulosonic-acid transferase
MRVLYTVLLWLCLPLELLRVLWRSRANREYLRSIPQRFGFVASSAAGQRPVWIHAVSVGETIAAQALIDRLRRRFPGIDIVISTTTPTGAAVARSRLGPDIAQFYFPYDLPGVVRRVLRRVDPALLILMETEIWPNLLRECVQRAVPAALVNARLSTRSMSGYRRAAWLFAPALQSLQAVCTQDQEQQRRFVELGVDPRRCRFCGNLKFDLPAASTEKRARLPDCGGRAVWIAASTHHGEESAVLEAFRIVRVTNPATLLVLAPRHPERFDGVEALCAAEGYTVQRHSHGTGPSAATDIYLLDTIGELPEFYALAAVAFVGGSLVDAGGHNLLEPARAGAAVVCGPNLGNFSEIAGLLADVQALELVGNASELGRCVARLLGDTPRRNRMAQAALQVCRANHGSAERVADALTPLLPPATQPAR